MPGRSNSTNKYGWTPFTVGPILGDGCTYSTVQSAIDDCFAAGGGVVLVKVGTYIENIIFRDGVEVIGGDVDGRVPVSFSHVVLQGNHSFSAAAGFNLCICENIHLEALVGDCLTLNATTGAVILFALKFSGLSAITDPASRGIVLNADGASGCQFSTDNSICSASSHLFESIGAGNGTVTFSLGSAVSTTGDIFRLTTGSAALLLEFCNATSSSASIMNDMTGAANVTFSYADVASANEAVLFNVGGSCIASHATINSSAASGFWIDGAAGSVDFVDIGLTGSAQGIGAAITQNKLNWQPYGEAAAAGPGSFRGTASFNSAQFTATDGFVEIIGGPAATTFPVDNGGPGVPLLGAMSVLGSTSVDFPNPSGIETHVGATTNEIYLEDRRFVSSLVVDPSATVGLRGEFQTITAALAVAVAGQTVYVRPGTYVESFAMVDDVNIVGLTSSASVGVPQAGALEGDVIVTGTISSAPTSSSSIQNLRVIGNGAACLDMVNGTILYATDCTFQNTVNPSVTFTSGELRANRCTFSAEASSTIEFVASGFLRVFDCRFDASVNCILAGVGSNASIFIDSSLLVSQNNPCIELQDIVNVEIWRTQIIANNGFGIQADLANGDIQLFYNFISSSTESLNLGAGATCRSYHNSFFLTAAPGQYIAGTGSYSYADDVINPISEAHINAGISETIFGWKPWAEAVAAPGTDSNKGTASFDSSQFIVSDGFVQTNFSGLFPWVDQAAPTTVVSNQGNFATAAIALTLPAAPAQGDVCKFKCTTAGALTITANAGQTLQVGSTTSAVAGTAVSTAIGDAMELTYYAAGTVWIANSIVGVWNVT